MNISALSAGLCANRQDLFFATSKSANTEAIAICERCPVYWKCLEYTLRLMPEYGVFAGLTRQDRQAMMKNARKIKLGHRDDRGLIVKRTSWILENIATKNQTRVDPFSLSDDNRAALQSGGTVTFREIEGDTPIDCTYRFVASEEIEV